MEIEIGDFERHYGLGSVIKMNRAIGTSVARQRWQKVFPGESR
jgi:hypothetical protein